MKWLAVSLALCIGIPSQAGIQYDPLAVDGSFEPALLDLTVQDTARNRTLPLLVYLPENVHSAPVILFSHGLGGSRKGAAYLGKHWAARGYICVFVQHPGSDVAVWKDIAPTQRKTALKRAASAKNYFLRVKDIPAVLNQLSIWNATPDHPLANRLDLDHVGMSGHSFGAVTTQAVSGQTAGRGSQPFTDSRIDAAIAFSPSSPRVGNPANAFGAVKIPWMLMTGTEDHSPIGNADLSSRLAVFPALPAGNKYELILYNAEHSAFTDRALPGDTKPRNPNHHRSILALSTAFWDAYLRHDDNAREWLRGQGPRSILQPKDQWQFK